MNNETMNNEQKWLNILNVIPNPRAIMSYPKSEPASHNRLEQTCERCEALVNSDQGFISFGDMGKTW